MRLRFVFRLAAGPTVGFGHLMRARALARALRVRPVISLRGGAAAAKAARALGCRLVAGGRRDTIAGADVLIVDDPSRSESRAWLASARRANVFTVAIRDQDRRPVDADLLVDGSAAATIPSSAARLVGPSFYVLDPRIGRRPSRRRTRRRVTRVIVALGGGKHVCAVGGRIAEAIGSLIPHVDIQVAAGLSNAPLPPLRCGRWVMIRGGLWRALRNANAAVVAGGVTLYETCAVGTPAVAAAVVAAQRPAITALASRGAVRDGGQFSVRRTIDRVAHAIAQLIAQPSVAERLGRRAAAIVDGRGAERVAASIRAGASRHREACRA